MSEPKGGEATELSEYEVAVSACLHERVRGIAYGYAALMLGSGILQIALLPEHLAVPSIFIRLWGIVLIGVATVTCLFPRHRTSLASAICLIITGLWNVFLGSGVYVGVAQIALGGAGLKYADGTFLPISKEELDKAISRIRQ
jgi:hypothetical protein